MLMKVALVFSGEANQMWFGALGLLPSHDQC